MQTALHYTTPPQPQPQQAAMHEAPTQQQLYLAYRDLYSPLWPATLEAALQSKAHRIAIEQVAKRRSRPALVPSTPHGLPRLPAPPTPGQRELTGPMKYGRSPQSLATGPMVELGRWPVRLKAYPNHNPFDAKKAAANDLDD